MTTIRTEAKKAVKAIVSEGRTWADGSTVVQIAPSGKLVVTHQTGNNFEAFEGDNYHDAKRRIVFSEQLDGDTRKAYRNPASWSENYQDWKQRTEDEIVKKMVAAADSAYCQNCNDTHKLNDIRCSGCGTEVAPEGLEELTLNKLVLIP